MQGDRPSAPGPNTDPHDCRTSSDINSVEGKLLTPLTKKQIKAVEKTLRGKVPFPPNLQIPHTARDSHFFTASTATNL
jgi:hypothetical protein